MKLWRRLTQLLRYSTDRTTAQQRFEELLGYRFRDTALLTTALTHRSYSHADTNNRVSNERLEFLGDSVLGLVVAAQLYRDYPEMREGQLTQTKALLVSESTLSEVGRDLKLSEFVRLATEEDRSGGRDRPSIIADTLESVIGAVFLDGGLEPARDIVLRTIYTRREEILADSSRRNFKGELLELLQARGFGLPRYDVVAEEGPDHEKVFHVAVYVGDQELGSGSGLSKKDAEQKAAAMALERYASLFG
ncbi:MAG TPA: ribonuclease III [Candidatus Deferrimicrobium sp.]|nr:ribonuclease III [Candidatus Deferrimicrobium sp.]